MDAQQYQEEVAALSIYKEKVPPEQHLAYVGLGLAGEAGEVSNKLKKALRNDGGITDERREQLKDELGDVMWYAAALCNELGIRLTDVMGQNVLKLHERKAESGRGLLHE